MSEDQGSLFERQETNPSAAAAGPAGEAISRRVLSRVGRGRGVIPPEAAEGLPGRVARLAYGRLPLHDALQHRWGASTVSWPDASDLPLVTGSTGARGVEMGFRPDEALPYPASSARTLPAVEARSLSDDRTTSDESRSGSEGQPIAAVGQPGVAPVAPPSMVASGLVAAPLLPVVKVSLSPAQQGSSSSAESLAAGSMAAGTLPATPANPVLVPTPAAPKSGLPPAPATLQRRIPPAGNKPTAVSRDVPAEHLNRPPEQSEPAATGPDSPTPPAAQPEPDERPMPVVRAQAVAALERAAPPAPPTLQRRTSATSDEPAAVSGDGPADRLHRPPEQSQPAATGPVEGPVPLVRAQAVAAQATPERAAPPAPPTLERRLSPTGDQPAAASRDVPAERLYQPIEQSEPAATGPVEPPVPVVHAQLGQVGPPAATDTLSPQVTETGAEADALSAVHLPPATAVARRTGAGPVTSAEQANIASRKAAPGVTRVWGEPIVQRVARSPRGGLGCTCGPQRRQYAPFAPGRRRRHAAPAPCRFAVTRCRPAGR